MGYLIDMYFVAFYIGQPRDRVADKLAVCQAIDIIMSINIFLNFFKVYQEDGPQRDLAKIVVNYLVNGFVLDMLATMPGLISSQDPRFYWFKLIRLYLFRHVSSHIHTLATQALTWFSVRKAVVERVAQTVFLLTVGINAVMILASVWIYIGRVTEGSWLEQGLTPRTGTTREINSDEEYDILVAAIYFIITTLTTVGYGDIYGKTPVEHLYQMIIEFLGINLFSMLMSAISNIIGTEPTLQDIIDERMEDLDVWLRKLDKSR